MQKKFTCWLMPVSIFLMGIVHAQSDYQTIIANITAGIKNGLNITSLNTTVTSYMSSQNTDGSWPDIAYAPGAPGDVPFDTHLTRVFQFAEAYTFAGGTHYGDTSLYRKLSLALEYWNANIHDADNWYYNQISYPQSLGEMLVLMRSGAKPLSIADSTATLNYLTSRDNPSTETGANRIDEAMHWLYRGVITANASVVSTAVTQGGSTLDLVNSGAEGINYDYAYLLHGPELQTQTYGSVLLSDVYNMVNYIKGTSYSYSTTEMQNAFVFLHNAFNAASRGKWSDFLLVGRAISRANNLDLNAVNTARAMNVDPAHYVDLRNDSLRLSGKQPASYNIATPYHIHFWTGDYTLHNRPNYQFSVRSRSTRTYNDEGINGENLLGAFLTEGATDIRVLGNEYYNIFPVWDWNMIPGVTMRNFSASNFPPNVVANRIYGTESFVGGVSDSIYGASANYMNLDNVAAKKSWFFFDDEVVCLGAGITSSSAETVTTCVNQALLNGSVSVNSGGAISTLTAQTQTSYSGNLQWALHGNIGYFFPSGGNINISNKTQTGSWSLINTGGATTTINTDVFKIWFDHGAAPTNATYAYIVLPNVNTTAQMTAYNQSNIKIISNTVSNQAVKHEGLHILEAIFRNSAGGTITDPTSRLKVSVDKPCALLIKNVGGLTLSASIADPSQTAAGINVSITFPDSTTAITKGIVLPEGNYKGSSAAFTIRSTDSSTNLPTYIAINNGNWATGSIWSGGSVPDSSSNVEIPNGLTVTVAAALTRGTPSTTIVNGTLVLSNTLISNGIVNINGGTIQVNQSGTSSTSVTRAHFVYDSTARLVFNNSSPTTVSDASIYWGRTYASNEFTTTAPRNIIIQGKGSVGTYGAGSRIVTKLLKVISNTSLTTSYSSSAVGSITINGTFEVAAAATINANLTCNGICQIDQGGSIVSGTAAIDKTGATATRTLVYGPSSILRYNTGSATSVGSEWLTGTSNPGYPANIEVVNGTVAGAGSIRSLSGNFTIDSGATFILNGDLNIGGNLVNNGTFTPNTNTVTFNGTDDSISGISNLYNLTLNNTSTLTLNNNLAIGNNLNLTSGKIIAGANTLSIANPTSITGGSSSSYVVTNGIGKLKINNIGSASGNVIFPAGYSTSSYTPLTLNNSGTTDNFSLNIQSPISSIPVTNSDKIVPVLWDLSEDVSGGSSAIITLQWNAADAAGASNYTIDSNNVIGHYVSGSWQKQAVTINGNGPYTAQNTVAYTSFSPFAVGIDGAFDGNHITALSLISFTASALSKQVTLKWQSVNEVDVSRYSIEKGSDGKTFAEIGSIAAKNEVVDNYSFTDPENYNPSYYRLKMINNDGSYNYSKVIPINSSLTDGLSVFPNPVRNKLNINYDASTQGGVISIYTINGQLINSFIVPAQSIQTIIDVSKYSSGSYILVFKSQNNKEIRQFIKL